MGKTELAFSLGDIPVIYVPLAQFQLVYKASLNEAFINAASKDLAPSTVMLIATFNSATQLSTVEPFYCCAICKDIWGRDD
jgi:hypothetical protein